MSAQEQYKLALRLLRLRLAEHRATYYYLRIMRSFGVSTPALEAATRTRIGNGMKFSGWTSKRREILFQERRKELHAAEVVR